MNRFKDQDEIPNGPAQVEPELYAMGSLTKREYFAGIAMQGLNAAEWGSEQTEEQIAKNAVGAADALIKQLNETPS